MRLSLLLLSCLVAIIGATSEERCLWQGALIFRSHFRNLNLTLIDPWKIVEHLCRIGSSGRIWYVFPEERPQHNPEFEYLCRITYCHPQNEQSQCGRKCAQRAPKIDFEQMRDRIYGINNTEPVPNKNVCKKECFELCGENDCRNECSYLCAVHFSYENRAEYETEIKAMFKRIFDGPHF